MILKASSFDLIFFIDRMYGNTCLSKKCNIGPGFRLHTSKHCAVEEPVGIMPSVESVQIFTDVCLKIFRIDPMMRSLNPSFCVRNKSADPGEPFVKSPFSMRMAWNLVVVTDQAGHVP